jgi:hypothetical protein
MGRKLHLHHSVQCTNCSTRKIDANQTSFGKAIRLMGILPILTLVVTSLNGPMMHGVDKAEKSECDDKSAKGCTNEPEILKATRLAD